MNDATVTNETNTDYLYYRTVSDDELKQIATGAVIRSVETINSPNTDGWVLILETVNHGLVSVRFDDLLGNAADPDDLVRIIGVNVAVLKQGKRTVKYLVP